MPIPQVEPEQVATPRRCPYCAGQYLKPYQRHCQKPLRDTQYTGVQAQRWQCLRCLRTSRLSPQGGSRAQHADRLKGCAVLRYLWGLSYAGVEEALSAPGGFLSKTTV